MSMSHIKDRLLDFHDWAKDIAKKYGMITGREFLYAIEQLQDDLEQDKKENGWIPVIDNKLQGKCDLGCTEGMDYCCICCPKKDECTAQCDYLDSYEYTEECRHYRKGE